VYTDADIRKRGYQNRLETCVVHAVNDEYLVLELFSTVGNPLNTPPVYYERKFKI